MNKLVVTFMMFFLVGTILSAIMEGGGGIAATQLTADITAADTTVTVSNTDGFLDADYIVVNNEQIAYSGKTDTTFTNCQRGWNDTTAVAHSTGNRAYNSGASVFNYALGFNVASTGASVGAIDMMVMAGRIFTVTIPQVILWDYSWLKVSEWLQYIRYVFAAITIGFVIYIVFNVLSALGGIAQGIFLRG